MEEDRRILTALDQAPAAVIVLRGPELRYQYLNQLAREIVPYVQPGDMFGAQTEQGARFRGIAEPVLRTGTPVNLSEVRVEVPGTRRVRYFDLAVQATRGAQGEIDGIVLIASEVTGAVEARRAQAAAETEQSRVQEKMREAQKLESLGVLAGGIAHDFNNLLTVILGNAALAQADLAKDHKAWAPLADVVHAAQRAAALTRQMLAYAGRGRFEIRPLDLRQIVREIGALLRSSIPKNVSLRIEDPDAIDAVQGDAAQLQQVVMNVVINAAEAIGEAPGEVVVTLSTEELPEVDAPGLLGADRAAPGRYVRVRVRDTGAGMDDQTRARIFDPFFTTKATGRGLGLAAVLGIVRSHGGAIRIETARGKGTVFDVLLPAAGARARPAREGDTAVEGGEGTILVIDDEPWVRSTAGRLLSSLGYDVLEAQDGPQGLALYEKARGSVIAVLIDLTMPELSGTETFAMLRKIDRDVPVIVCSGYAEAEIAGKLGPLSPAAILHKPFTRAELARAVADAIAEE